VARKRIKRFLHVGVTDQLHVSAATAAVRGPAATPCWPS
jgi:hypothetical protein